MSNYMVEAKSRANLRSLARILREHLHLDDVLYFPIVELLDVMTELFDDFNYEVVEDKVLSKKVHADTDIRTGHIRIKESVYEGACNGEGRDRMTIAHEIGHFLLCAFAVSDWSVISAEGKFLHFVTLSGRQSALQEN